jgi:hypothetical protein
MTQSLEGKQSITHKLSKAYHKGQAKCATQGKQEQQHTHTHTPCVQVQHEPGAYGEGAQDLRADNAVHLCVCVCVCVRACVCACVRACVHVRARARVLSTLRRKPFFTL